MKKHHILAGVAVLGGLVLLYVWYKHRQAQATQTKFVNAWTDYYLNGGQ